MSVYHCVGEILGIGRALDVSPQWLLSGVDPAEDREENQEYYMFDVCTETGLMVNAFNRLDK